MILLCGAVRAGSGRPSPRPRPRPSPTPKPTMPRQLRRVDDRRRLELSEHHRHRADAVLKANYSSGGFPAITQHGHATYECAEHHRGAAQYDKAEPYLWCVLHHRAGCDVNGMCPQLT